MTQKEQQPAQRHWFLTLLSVLSYVAICLAIALQIAAVILSVQIKGLPPGEGRSWAAFAWLLTLIYSKRFIAPIMLIAVVRAVMAAIAVASADTRTRAAIASLVFHAFAAALPYVTRNFIEWQLHQPEPSKPQVQVAPPKTRADEMTEGAEWAQANDILREEDCKTGSPNFIEGCKRAVQRRNGRY